MIKKGDKNSYFLPICRRNWRLSTVVFLTSVATTTLLLMGMGRSEALESTSTASDSVKTGPANSNELHLGSFRRAETGIDSDIDSSLPVKLDESKWHVYTIKTEGGLHALASRIGINAEDVDQVLSLGGATRHLSNLYFGDTLKINFDHNRLLALQYDIHQAKRLKVIRIRSDKRKAVFEVSTVNRPLTVTTVRISGEIKESLYKAARSAGLSKEKTMELIRIFDCKIDYSRDIKKGDTFVVVYEQRYRGDERVAESPILAAQFANDNKVYNAIRYTAPNDKARYYTPNGIGLRTSFLRNPVDYPLISSGFDPERKHPILHRIRAHRGVDYAAKLGTPIKATGDGFLKFIGRKGGYGKTIILQHRDGISTLYAHMQKYAGNLKPGDRVRQGDIIGYVGKTGRATGTHLHYEFHINGIHVDPLKIHNPTITIPENHKYDFMMKSQLLLTQINGIEKINVAWNKSEHKDASLN